MTPYYDEGGITIYHGDSRDIELPEDSAVVSDPPYGIGWNTDYTRFTSGFGTPRTKHPPVHGDDEPFDPTPWLDYDEVILWGAQFYADKLPVGTWLVWDKRFGNGTAFLSDAELAWSKGGRGVYIHAVTSQGCIRPEPIQHPTQKPVSLMSWCIRRTESAVVIDPFMGSGTTLRAAKDLGRKAIGIEIEERYCEIAAERLRQQVFDMNPLD